MLKGAPKSSRDDPEFMANYFKSSRLHFIGTWKARIEALAARTAGGARRDRALVFRVRVGQWWILLPRVVWCRVGKQEKQGWA